MRLLYLFNAVVLADVPYDVIGYLDHHQLGTIPASPLGPKFLYRGDKVGIGSGLALIEIVQKPQQ